MNKIENMIFLKTFEKYNKSIVSIDFDGVLHLSMIENTIGQYKNMVFQHMM